MSRMAVTGRKLQDEEKAADVHSAPQELRTDVRRDSSLTVKGIRCALASMPRTEDNEGYSDEQLVLCEDDDDRSPDDYLYWFSCADLTCLQTHSNCEDDTE